MTLRLDPKRPIKEDEANTIAEESDHEVANLELEIREKAKIAVISATITIAATLTAHLASLSVLLILAIYTGIMSVAAVFDIIADLLEIGVHKRNIDICHEKLGW